MRISANHFLQLFAITLLMAGAGCSGKKKDQFVFDGVAFKAKTKPVDKKVSLADFTATIFDVSLSLDGAREAAAYEGVKYCIANYGTSDIDWAIGPETEPEKLTIVDNAITFQGRCDK